VGFRTGRAGGQWQIASEACSKSEESAHIVVVTPSSSVEACIGFGTCNAACRLINPRLGSNRQSVHSRSGQTDLFTVLNLHPLRAPFSTRHKFAVDYRGGTSPCAWAAPQRPGPFVSLRLRMPTSAEEKGPIFVETLLQGLRPAIVLLCTGRSRIIVECRDRNHVSVNVSARATACAYASETVSRLHTATGQQRTRSFKTADEAVLAQHETLFIRRRSRRGQGCPEPCVGAVWWPSSPPGGILPTGEEVERVRSSES